MFRCINFHLTLEQMWPRMNKWVDFCIDDECPIFRIVFGHQHEEFWFLFIWKLNLQPNDATRLEFPKYEFFALFLGKSRH